MAVIIGYATESLSKRENVQSGEDGILTGKWINNSASTSLSK